MTFVMGCGRKQDSSSPVSNVSKKEKHQSSDEYLRGFTRKWCLNHVDAVARDWNFLKRYAQERASCNKSLTDESRLKDFENCGHQIIYTLRRIQEEEPYINGVLENEDCQKYDNKDFVRERVETIKKDVLLEVKKARKHFYLMLNLLHEKGQREQDREFTSQLSFMINFEVLHNLFYKSESFWYQKLMSPQCALSRHSLFSDEDEKDKPSIKNISSHYNHAYSISHVDYFKMKQSYQNMKKVLKLAEYGMQEECELKDVEKQLVQVRLKEAKRVISHFEKLDNGKTLKMMCDLLENTSWITKELEAACEKPTAQTLNDNLLIKAFSIQLTKRKNFLDYVKSTNELEFIHGP